MAAFIRGILDPFWRAGTIDRETYKRVLQRAASKVAAAHAGAKDARFLIAESDKIHKLVKQYLMQ